MTETPLERARREAHDDLCPCSDPSDCHLGRAIARLELAARLEQQERVAALLDSVRTLMNDLLNEKKVASVRLAAVHELAGFQLQEADHLRAELEKASK